MLNQKENKIMISRCPNCGADIRPDEVLTITRKHSSKIKRSGEGEGSFPVVRFREYGCPHCGIIFIDNEEIFSDMVKLIELNKETVSK